MMISPKGYIEQLKDADYPELIRQRDELIDRIREYERKEIAGDRSGSEWCIEPSPDVHYQMDLEYLGKLCAFMQEKYNEEYVWVGRKW